MITRYKTTTSSFSLSSNESCFQVIECTTDEGDTEKQIVSKKSMPIWISEMTILNILIPHHQQHTISSRKHGGYLILMILCIFSSKITCFVIHMILFIWIRQIIFFDHMHQKTKPFYIYNRLVRWGVSGTQSIMVKKSQ